EQIDEMDSWEGSQLNKAKEILAYELTALVHGEEEAKKAEASAKALFGGAGDAANMPTTTLAEAELENGGLDIVSLLVKSGLCSSRGDARRNVQQGGVSANDEKVTDANKVFSAEELSAGITLRRGKKNYNRVVLG
ncbi:MAG: tyrosine--tRNA ligase, partial [Oscillospiraceae bacterium]|nr:tyrosine--tRNA ligase [Oscillospiraceae bacterium]